MKKGFIIALMTSLLFVISAINVNIVSAKSIKDTENSISNLEKEQNKLKNDQSKIHSNKNETDKKINENKNKQTSIEKKLLELNKEINTTESLIEMKLNEIKETDDDIGVLEKRIIELKVEIIKLEKRIAEREELLKDRLRSMQKSGGNVGFIEVVLGSKNFNEFLSRSSAVKIIMNQDKSIMEAQEADIVSLEEKQEEIESKKDTLENKKLMLEEQKKELVSLKNKLDEKAKEQRKIILQLKKENIELKEFKLSLNEEEKVLAAQEMSLKKAKKSAIKKKNNLIELAQKKEAEKLDAAAKASTSNKNGIFSWPVQGRVSSHYGFRNHPILGKQLLHAGTDIAVSKGTPLKSAAPGVVSVAQFLGGYGNVVMITHVIDNKTYTTVYAHLNSISVSPGQQVSSGQLIGSTGNTGNSTGPHLHFEVHLGKWSASNNNAVNPLNYLK